jgi:predicted amidophosphoribosyltransferase
MPFINPTEFEDVHHLGEYNPYHGGNNPKFNEFSRKILRIKGDSPDRTTIDYFFRELDPKFKEEIAIAVVPGHDPKSTHSGIKTIAELLAKKNRIDATCCLVRETLIKKLAEGGPRARQIHENSIVVKDTHLIKGQNILLLDDVSTSKNSILVCKDLLLNAGAAKVTCFVLGQTV